MPQRPEGRYVGLYGSHSGDWRVRCTRRLDSEGIAWYDPTSLRWQGVTGENGDERQDLIDELVAEQHEGIRNAACVLYHLAAKVSYTDTHPVPDKAGDPVTAFAARCELGFLTGRGLPTFAHVEPDVEGRNYLWAQMKPYLHVRRCDTLDEALDAVVLFMLG